MQLGFVNSDTLIHPNGSEQRSSNALSRPSVHYWLISLGFQKMWDPLRAELGDEGCGRHGEPIWVNPVIMYYWAQPAGGFQAFYGDPSRLLCSETQALSVMLRTMPQIE